MHTCVLILHIPKSYLNRFQYLPAMTASPRIIGVHTVGHCRNLRGVSVFCVKKIFTSTFLNSKTIIFHFLRGIHKRIRSSQKHLLNDTKSEGPQIPYCAKEIHCNHCDQKNVFWLKWASQARISKGHQLFIKTYVKTILINIFASSHWRCR